MDASEEGLKKAPGSDVSDELLNDLRWIFQYRVTKKGGNTMLLSDFKDFLKKWEITPVGSASAFEAFKTAAGEAGNIDEARFLEWAVKNELDVDKTFGTRDQRQMWATSELFEALERCGPTQPSIVASLLKARANPNGYDDEPRDRALHRCIKHGTTSKLEVLELLLAARAEVDAPGEYRRTPLQFLLRHCGAGPQTSDILTALLQAGADVNAKGELGATVLHTCCGCQVAEDLARRLIDAKADVNAKDDKGKLPWQWIPDESETDEAKSLRQLLKVSGGACKQPGAGKAHTRGTELPAAVQAGDLDLVKKTLKQLKGELSPDCASKVLCDLPKKDEKAASACARELLAAKADVDGTPGNRPVKVMSEAGCWHVVELLLDARADLNVKNVEEYFDNGPRARLTHPIYWDVKALAEEAGAEKVLAAIAHRKPPPADASEMSFAERFA